MRAGEPEIEHVDRNHRAIARALAREDPALHMELIRAWAVEAARVPGGDPRAVAWRLEDRVSAYFEAHPEALERLVRHEVEAVVYTLVAMARSCRALNPKRAGSKRGTRHDPAGSMALPEGTIEGVTALVLRDSEGTLYVLDERAIRACRALPAQQALLSESFADHEEVSGFLFVHMAGLGALELRPMRLLG